MGALIAIVFVGLFVLIAMGRLALVNRRWRQPRIPRNGIGGLWPIFPVDSNIDNPPSPDGQEPPHHHHHGHHHHHHHDGGMPTDGGHHGHHGGFDGGGHHHGGGGFDGGGHSHGGGGFDSGGGGGHSH